MVLITSWLYQTSPRRWRCWRDSIAVDGADYFIADARFGEGARGHGVARRVLGGRSGPRCWRPCCWARRIMGGGRRGAAR